MQRQPIDTNRGAQPESPRLGCPACGHRFSTDARFCPFDGDPLLPLPLEDRETDARIGQLLGGRFLIEARIGEGGMGAVYRARHRILDKCVAIKVMRADLAKDRVVVARFIQEARAIAAIEHPRIVEVIDFGELDDAVPYFVMELLEGRSLSSLLREDGPFPAKRAARLVRHIASALEAAHAAGIVHRDLKPDNIHVGDGDSVKVLDFGVAKILGSSRLTRTGMIFGTPHYMSPEQASGEEVDGRADIYALGVVLYELLTGRVPFEADSFMGVLTKHLYTAPEPPSRLRPRDGALGKLEAITLRCLEKKPERRFASASELIAALDSLELASGTADSVPDRASTAPPTSSTDADELSERLPLGPSPKLIATVVLGMALAAVAIWALLRRAPHSPADARGPHSPADAGGSYPPADARGPHPPAPSPASGEGEPVTASPALGAIRETPLPEGSSPSPPRTLSPSPRRTPSPSRTPPPSPPQLGASEIIDPWAD